jgi:hypothetical protein
MGGMVVLLLLGTQILNWYWVVLLAVASLAAGLYRARKKIPSVYTIAQWIDRRLNLADTLSTATYFSGADASLAASSTTASARAEIRRQQREQAERTAQSVDVRQGIPFMRPRYLYPALILAAVAFGMFVLRYAVTGSLSLQPSLARIAFDTFFPSTPEQAKINRKQPDRSKMDPDSPDDPQGDQQQDAALEAMDRNNPADPQASQRTQESKQGDRSGQNDDAVKKDTSQQDESQNGEQKEGKQAPQQGGNSPNQNLMDKLRDVMSNMMNKMTSSGQNPSQQNKSSSGQPDKANAANKKSQKSSDKADDSSQSSPEQAQNDSENPSSDKAPDKTASPDGKSGIGASDGDKKAREAEQEQVMGKISEILGKRSAGVSGEVMVEVGSSRQQLKTPWAPTEATHAEAGGEIHRDEVPLIYQQFVEQYFEQIRKPAAKTARQ